MVWLRWFGAGLAVGLFALWGWTRLQHGEQAVVLDLVASVDQASLRRPGREVFGLRAVTVAGTSRQSISVAQASRIAWDVDVPAHTWLEGFVALEESAWTAPGDGVLFRVGLSFDNRYEEVVTQVVNPSAVPGDRRWIPVMVDLSPYAGRRVSLILNTGSVETPDNDLAAWGEIRLVTK